jgi:hypothetical protein
LAHDAIRLSFKIDAFQPDSIPMARLAEYMSDLAALIGEKDSVHFVEVKDGCVQLIHKVAFTAYPKVEERTRAVREGDAPDEAMNAFRALNKKLAQDNTFASYAPLDDEVAAAVVLDFPGINQPKPVTLAPVEQPGSIVGVVQGVGGKSYVDNVPVYIDTGEWVYSCAATRAVAKELGRYILGEERRFDGTALWQRDEDGAWTLKKFTIRTHEPLEASTLSETVDQLRAIPSDLSEIPDPWGDIMRSRREEGEPH